MGLNLIQSFAMSFSVLVTATYIGITIVLLRKTKAKLDISALITIGVFGLLFIVESVFWMVISISSPVSEVDFLKSYITQSYLQVFIINILLFYFLFEMKFVKHVIM